MKALLTTFIVAVSVFTVRADVFTVTTLSQSNTPPYTVGSLAWAIDAANSSGSSPHTIQFAPGVTGTIAISGSFPTITEPLTIEGPGSADLTIRSENGNRLFSTLNGTNLTLRDLKLESGSKSGFLLERAGAAFSSGNLTMRDCWVEGFIAKRGGGVSCAGSMTLSRCIFEDNDATLKGGAVYVEGAGTILNCTFSGNSAPEGGGVFVDSTTIVLIDHCTMTENLSTTAGAGMASVSNFTQVTNSIVAGNFLQGKNTAAGQSSGPISFAAANLLSGDPDLYPLRQYGNNQPYHLPRYTSPAIDGGATSGSTSTDARGSNRPFPTQGHFDLGAVEVYSVEVTDPGFAMPGNPPATNSLPWALDIANSVGRDIIYLKVGPDDHSAIEPIFVQSEMTLNRHTVLASPGNVSLVGGAGRRILKVASGITMGLDKMLLEDADNTGSAGGAILVEPFGRAYLDDTQIKNCSAACGGGIRVDSDGLLHLNRCYLAFNSATADSGAVELLARATLEANNTTFRENSCGNRGGHLGIFTDANPTMMHCTFVGGSSGGFNQGDAVYSNSAIVRVSNCYLLSVGIEGEEFFAQNGGLISTLGTVLTRNLAEVSLTQGGHSCVPFYRLRPQSRAIGTASTLFDLPFDVEGRRRDESPDAGTSEYFSNRYIGHVSRYFSNDELCSPLGYLETYGPGADADADGQSNLRELILAGSILGDDTPPDPAFLALQGSDPNPDFQMSGVPLFSFRYDKRFEEFLTIAAYESTDLQNWSTALALSGSTDFPYQSLTVTSFFAHPKTFFQVRTTGELPLFEPVTVTVGSAGNAANPANGLGAVSYQFDFGKFEITRAAWVTFLNAVDPTGANALNLFQSGQGISLIAGASAGEKYVGSGDMAIPVGNVNFFSALRFCNWLHNGAMPGADTEDGAYLLTGGIPFPSNRGTITRKSGARFALPTRDEWYKAAQFRPGGANPSVAYSTYATGSDPAPQAGPPAAGDANYANWFGHAIATGSYEFISSPWGAKDTAGNVEEWTETKSANPEFPYVVGGSYNTNSGTILSGGPLTGDSNYTQRYDALNDHLGFRVVRLAP